jgi:hypothetical protein
MHLELFPSPLVRSHPGCTFIGVWSEEIMKVTPKVMHNIFFNSIFILDLYYLYSMLIHPLGTKYHF